MEKLKFNQLRFFICLISLMIICDLILFLDVGISLKSPVRLVFLQLLSLTALMILSIIHQRKSKEIFFNEDEIIIKKGQEVLVVSYDDLLIDSTRFSYTTFNFSKIYMKSKKNSMMEDFELNWFTEQSLSILTKRYLKDDHQLSVLVDMYMKNRKFF